MTPEGRELLRGFFRRWSTTDITDESRAILKQDVLDMTVMLKIYGDGTLLIEEAEFQHEREWFALRHREL